MKLAVIHSVYNTISQDFLFFKEFIYLFIGCLGSSLQCSGLLLWQLLLLWSTGSRCTGFSNCGTRALERRLSSYGAWAQLLHGMWDLPGPGLKPLSPALAGRFLTTAPPEKPLSHRILMRIRDLMPGKYLLSVGHGVTVQYTLAKWFLYFFFFFGRRILNHCATREALSSDS